MLAILIITMITGNLSVTGALVALGLLATAEVFADNTSATLTPMLVHHNDLPTANARLQTGFITLNQLVGPPIGAALFAAGIAWPFLAEAVLVTAGVVLVSRVVLPAHGHDSANGPRRAGYSGGFPVDHPSRGRPHPRAHDPDL